MSKHILALKTNWNWPDHDYQITEKEIELFELSTELLIPGDLADYFKVINGTDGYDDNSFSFYSLNELESFDQYNSLYVFADYQCKLFLYVIKLYKSKSKNNEIYIFCGKDYKIIATSFTDFIDLCLQDSQKLFFND